MKCVRSSAVAMMGSLLLLSTASAQVNTSLLARPSAKENPKTWTRFTADTDKFGVVMPTTPKIKREIRVIGGQQLSLNYYGATSAQSDFAVVTLAGLSVANWDLSHMLMLDFYCRSSAAENTSQGFSSVKAIFQKHLALDGYAGRQFSLETAERLGEWRIYEVNKNFYAVAASSNSRYANSFRRFFDSFSLAENNTTMMNANTAVGNRVSNSTDRWFIILQTFSRNERAKANRTMSLLQGQGYDTQVISTDSYSNLRPGLLALTMGPFSKRAAQERLGELRSVAPQSYIKAGW